MPNKTRLQCNEMETRFKKYMKYDKMYVKLHQENKTLEKQLKNLSLGLSKEDMYRIKQLKNKKYSNEHYMMFLENKKNKLSQYIQV